MGTVRADILKNRRGGFVSFWSDLHLITSCPQVIGVGVQKLKFKNKEGEQYEM
jgi:hypothetical protein